MVTGFFFFVFVFLAGFLYDYDAQHGIFAAAVIGAIFFAIATFFKYCDSPKHKKQ